MTALLSDVSWEEVEQEMKETKVALIPVGSTEQYGYHMSMGSDSYCAYEVARRTAAKEKVIIIPMIPFGISHCHISFPGTITLSCDTLSGKSWIELGLIAGVPDVKRIPVHLNGSFQIN